MFKIALHGKARSGKNTIANILDQILNPKQIAVFQYSFAEPIKKIAEVMFPNLPKKWLYGSSELRSNVIPNAQDDNGNPLTVRRLITDLGKQGRKYNLNIWVNAVLDKIKLDLTSKDYFNPQAVLITDLRFQNELKRLKEEGYFLIKILRPNNPYNFDDISEKDLSEVPDSDFNLIFSNDIEDTTQNHSLLQNKIQQEIIPLLK